MSKKATVVVVDDHAILREGLCRLLEENGTYEVIGQAADGFEAQELAKQLEPDVILMDMGLPGLNGADTTRKILQRNPAMRIVGLSMHSDPQFVTAMLKAGAAGYVLKDSAYDELTMALEAIQAGKVYLSPTVAGAVVTDLINETSENGGGSGLSRLSPREREVLQLMAEGCSTAEVAEKLHISSKTVETHRKNLMEKLDIHNIAELTKFAIRHGLTSLDY